MVISMERHVQSYLQRAKEAEVSAASHTDELLKKQWRDIACAYRNLAQARLFFIANAPDGYDCAKAS